MNAAIAWMLALLLPVAAAAGSRGSPVVYHSPDGQGTRPASSPFRILPRNDQPLHLYLDYDNQPDPGASSGNGTMCVDEDGGETCAFDVQIVLHTDSATFDTFLPAAPEIVGRIDPVTRTSFRVNGVDPNGLRRAGFPGPDIPLAIGTLTLDAAGAKELQIEVVGVHRVGAAGQLDAIQRHVIMPEPTRGALLASGIAALLALRRLRRRR